MRRKLAAEETIRGVTITIHKNSTFNTYFILLCVFLSGCSIKQSGSKPIYSRSDEDMSRRLRAEVRQWEGTPYRFGGTSRYGIDCSGFAMTLYKEAIGIQLPRTTKFQAQMGEAIPLKRLRVGDLVFFVQPDKKLHSGVYLGSDEFAHASTIKGVTVSKITDPFWKQSFWKARRVFQQ